MAMPIYMRIKGSVTGDFIGGCTVAEYQDAIQVRALSHNITVPTDESTGAHIGKRVHAPLTILKDMDSATPLLYMALTNHEELDVELFWYRHEPSSGGEEHYFTTTLERATIISVSNTMKNQYVKENQNEPHMEEIKLAYHTIRWNYEPAGLEAQDSHSQTV
jgi:type VI secretion system secreted protein Hcp